MPQFSTEIREKIEALQAIRAAGGKYSVYEFVEIAWPDGAVYYSNLPLDELPVAPSVTPIQVRLIKDEGSHFIPVTMDSSIGDEELDLEFGDMDGEFSDLLETHGEGALVSLYYFVPEVELELLFWVGHLRMEDEAEIDKVKIKAVNGFRTSDAVMPNRNQSPYCKAIFGGLLETQEEIDRHENCKYNRHIGGMVGNLNGMVPYTFCPRRTRQNCIDRLSENGNNMLSHATAITTVVNNQTKGPRLLSTSIGNDTNNDEKVRVVMGTRRMYGWPVLVERRDYNNNNPGDGFYTAIYGGPEGPIASLSQVQFHVGGITQNAAYDRYAQRLGAIGQIAIDPTLSAHSFSGTVQTRYYLGRLNPAEVDTKDVTCSALVRGLNNIRVYSDEDTFTETYTSNRVWQIARMLCDTRWGFGLDYSRFNINSLIESAEWLDKNVRFIDPDGTVWDHKRDSSHVELIERKAQQQIEDMCLAGRLSRPFIFDGKIHIIPLRKATDDELENAIVFTEGVNIGTVESNGAEKPSLKRNKKSDATLINRIECTFDEASSNYAKKDSHPVEDIDYQLKAGRVVGDKSKKVNPKKYHLMGVTGQAEAVKLSFALLDLGEFDEGGIQNNLRITFDVWFVDALELHPAKIIKVESPSLTRYGFEYFRVVEMERHSDLSVTVTAQAYNHEYMESFEVEFADIPGPSPDDPPPPTPPNPEPIPCALQFGNVTYQDGQLSIPPLPC